MRSSLLAVLACLVALAGCGGGSTGDAPGNGTDRAFAAAMVPHHEAAVAMARIGVQRGESPFVRQLAADMVRTQQTEIATLREQDAALARAGVRRSTLTVADDDMGMAMDVDALRRAQPFDPAFLRMMIPHHEGALAMAKAEIAQGRDPELKRLAERVLAGQSGEIRAMRGRLPEY